MMRLGLRLTPQGHLVLEEAEDALAMDEKRAVRLAQAFAQGTGAGLVLLGAAEIGNVLPPALAWWREFASRYVTSLCLHWSATIGGASSPSVVPDVPAPTDGELTSLVLAGPMMPGAEYLTTDVLRAQWTEIGRAIATSLSSAATDLQSFLKGLNPAWNLVGRVHFNLAENRGDPESPFAFMATYTTQLSAHGKARHQPLGRALREYAGTANKNRLLSLLVPVQRAAESCTWLKPMVNSGEIYHPLRWTPQEASRFLASVPELERAGVVVRMPGFLARQSAPTTAGDGDCRRSRAIRDWSRRVAGFPHGNDAGRRSPDQTGDQHAALRD